MMVWSISRAACSPQQSREHYEGVLCGPFFPQPRDTLLGAMSQHCAWVLLNQDPWLMHMLLKEASPLLLICLLGIQEVL